MGSVRGVDKTSHLKYRNREVKSRRLLDIIMAKKFEISEEGLNELREARKRNRNKNVERRLHALILHAEGNTGKKVSELTGYNEKYLYELYRKYLTGGIEAITGNHYGGNRRNMSYEEEEIFLSQFINEADGGHITDVKAIKAAYDEKVGHETGHGQIYFVLHRHGWSKKLPRSKHPKSASPEAVEASKKLTLESEN